MVLEIFFPKYQESSVVYDNAVNVTSTVVTLTYTGEISFFVRSDSNDWEQVTLAGSGVAVAHVFTNAGQEIKWKAVLANPDSFIDEIQMQMVEV